MSKIKMLFFQTSFISLGIFLAVGVAQAVMHFTGNTYATDWYFLLSVILAGVLCSLPSFVTKPCYRLTDNGLCLVTLVFLPSRCLHTHFCNRCLITL